MRRLLLFALLLGITSPISLRAQTPVSPEPYGLTVEEEARILALEDRRQFDPELVAAWVKHPNALHRARIALALGRIGPHTFADANENGQFEAGKEKRAGVKELEQLASDKDGKVRLMVAFALGEIGDETSGPSLWYLSADEDPAVAAEAAEAVSKLAVLHRQMRVSGFTRYQWLLDEKLPEAVRARATRFLFRFDSDDASRAAVRALASKSSQIRQEAAYSLARRAFADGLTALHLVTTDSNVLTRAYAATALGQIADPSSMPHLVKLLGDIHPWVRTNAANAIAKVAAKTPASMKTSDLPRIFAAAADPDPGVRAVMVDVLGLYASVDGEAKKRLVSTLKNGTRWEREIAAGVIAKRFDADSPEYKLLTDLTPWQIVRVIEATSGGERGTPLRRKGAAVRATYAKHPDAMVRAAVLGSIPDDGVDRELEMINAGFKDPDVMVRAAAYDRYGKVTVDKADVWVPKLLQAEAREQKESLNDARIAAIQAMALYGFRGLREELDKKLADPDPVVRRIAAELITRHYKGSDPQYTPLQVTRTDAEYQEIVRWSRQPHTATIHMSRGKIELALLGQDAPMTAWNFAQLAKKKYFDGTTFMRVVPNFVVQGGDPRNDMSGGPGYAIRDEINLQKYTRGAVGMALSGPDTGGSQFFITHSPQPHLDGGYTIFARVYDGMNSVVDQIERGDRVEKITIDEHPPVGSAEVDAVPNVSLPLEVGTMTREGILEALPDYRERSAAYQPDATVLEMMKSYVKPGDRLEVFMGTWCQDSQREVPKLLRISDDLKAQGVELPVTFFAIDRSKQKPENLVAGKSLAKIATFIYYRDGRELGRIEERPVSLFEDDLLAIAGAGAAK